jgi:tRNA(Ile)-lysidine synthase
LSGKKVLVAFSGGKDSCSLLHFIAAHKTELAIEISACHVNHMIRGENALRDEEFCRLFSAELGVEFYAERRDVPALAKELGCSLEHAARTLRYEALAEAADKAGAAVILTAHTYNDRIESFFIKSFQGSSLATLGGLEEELGNLYRPMLCITSEQVEDYVERNGLNPVFDETNLDETYLRNWVRGSLIPLVKNKNTAFTDRIIDLLNESRELNAHMNKYALEVISEKEESFAVSLHLYDKYDEYVKKYILHTFFSPHFRVEKRHIAESLSLAESAESRRIDLPDGWRFEKSYSHLRLFHRSAVEAVCVEKQAGVGELELRNRRFLFSGRLVGERLVLRTRRDGDRIGSKKLKDLMIDRKTELFHRDRALLLEHNGVIIWAEGLLEHDNVKLF